MYFRIFGKNRSERQIGPPKYTFAQCIDIVFEDYTANYRDNIKYEVCNLPRKLDKKSELTEKIKLREEEENNQFKFIEIKTRSPSK